MTDMNRDDRDDLLKRIGQLEEALRQALMAAERGVRARAASQNPFDRGAAQSDAEIVTNLWWNLEPDTEEVEDEDGLRAAFVAGLTKAALGVEE